MHFTVDTESKAAKTWFFGVMSFWGKLHSGFITITVNFHPNNLDRKQQRRLSTVLYVSSDRGRGCVVWLLLSSPQPLKIDATNSDWQTEMGRRGFSLWQRLISTCIAAHWLTRRLPLWQPKPQDSPDSNGKHLFRSDNPAQRLWGPSLRDIKRMRRKREKSSQLVATKDTVGLQKIK